MSEEDALSIGEVINLLRDDFPDVSISKVRFLESQGLLAPGRSEGGYRQFDSHDLARLQFILRQQRDHFLPLKVIKSKLTLWERGEEPDESSKSPTKARNLVSKPRPPISRADLLRRGNADESLLNELIEHGLLAKIDADEDLYDPGAVGLITEAKRLLELGLEVRHLRTVKHAAERESDVLAQLTGAMLRSRSEESQEQARQLLEDAGEAVIALHKLLLAAEIRKLLAT